MKRQYVFLEKTFTLKESGGDAIMHPPAQISSSLWVYLAEIVEYNLSTPSEKYWILGLQSL